MPLSLNDDDITRSKRWPDATLARFSPAERVVAVGLGDFRSEPLSGNASVMSIASRNATSSSRVIGAPLRPLRRNDQVGWDQHRPLGCREG